MVDGSAASVVTGSGADLMGASPSGPGQIEAGWRMFVVISFANRWRISMTVSGMSPGSVGRRCSVAAMAARIAAAHDQGGVAMPGVPAADLVLVETDGAFRVLEAALDGVTLG